MSIHIVLGKPGSGKSYYATKRVIIRELREGRRNIVTNVPLRPDILNAFLQRVYPKEDLNMTGRLRMLSDSELRYFWKFRSPSDVGPPELEELERGVHAEPEILPSGKKRDVPLSDDYRKLLTRKLNEWAKTPTHSDNGVGVLYVLDEAHIAFNARAWASCADAALFYLSQHRKLGDQVWPITQAPGNLDKQFRSVAEDFTVLRNEYQAKYGIFKGRGRFTWKTFASEPSGAKTDGAFLSGDFEIEPNGAASCYDTAKGIGVHGSKADIGKRAKGINILWAIPMMIGVASLCGLVPWLMGKGAGSFLTSGTKKEMAEKSGGLVPSALPSQQSVPSTQAAAVAPIEFAVVSGVMMRGNQLLVGVHGRGWLTVSAPVAGDALMLSDGTLVRRRDVISGGGVSAALKAQELDAKLRAQGGA